LIDPRELARRLADNLESTLLARLAADSRAAIESCGLQVVPLAAFEVDGECACDGIFHAGPPPAIAYRPTPRSRRGLFTLLHEFGHYLVKSRDDILSELADIGDDGGRQIEERVCDSFAAGVLIPDDIVMDVLADGKPLAKHLGEIYGRTKGSREACAVRMAERLPYFGYVAVADPGSQTVRFASPSRATPYPWRRGTRLSKDHALVRTAELGTYRGQAYVEWPSGDKQQLWIDAVRFEEEVHAVLTQRRYWEGTGLSFIEGGVHAARPSSYSGVCPHCKSQTWGTRLHGVCGELWCRRCKRCSCDAPPALQAATQMCTTCGLIKRSNLFRQQNSVCVDCE